MLLAIDIGNSNIVVGVFDKDKIKATWRIATGVHRMWDEYAIILVNLLAMQNLKLSQIDGVVMCSVVPPIGHVWEEMSKRYIGMEPLVVGAGVKTGVRIALDNPREVGADRVVHAAAAHHLYGGPCIIIDLGTATTFDVVSKEGDHLGGAIAPGIIIATEALTARTSALPRIDLVRPKRAIGKNTVAAMQSGIVFGYVGLIEGIVKRIKEEFGSPMKVIATGGNAALIARETKIIDIVEEDLILVGLRVIWEMNKSS
ncbi:MAG: type III pantothenate kinase [Chloroflexota bacterium]